MGEAHFSTFDKQGFCRGRTGIFLVGKIRGNVVPVRHADVLQLIPHIKRRDLSNVYELDILCLRSHRTSRFDRGGLWG